MSHRNSIVVLVAVVLALSGCCSAPRSMKEYAYKIGASPEVQIPKVSGQYFVPIAITNDSVSTLCFARTGDTNGITPLLEIDISENAPVSLVRTDLSGLSGVRLKRGRTMFGFNSPVQNTPLGFYLAPNTATNESGIIRWRLILQSEKAAQQRVIASGTTKVRRRGEGESYLLMSEQVPFPSRFEAK